MSAPNSGRVSRNLISTQIDETVSSAEPQTIAAVRPSTTTSLHSEREAFRRIGRPPHDWDGTIKRRVFELMDYHGPFSADDPDWNVQARLVEKIEDEFEVTPPRFASTSQP